MKKISVILSIVAVAFITSSMSSCIGPINSITASNVMAKEFRTVSDFDKLEVEGIFEVDVTYSSTEEIEIDAPENVMEYIELNVTSKTLHVELSRSVKINSGGAIKIHIKTAKLNGFELSGATSVTLNNTLKDNSLSLESSGAASFKGDVEVNEADIELSGAATVNLSGNAAEASLELSGASQVNNYSFKVDDLDVDLSGASSAQITSSKRIEGDLSGASSLMYKGNAVAKSVSVSGAAKLKKK